MRTSDGQNDYYRGSQAAGPLTITFRFEFGEIALPHTSMKAKFDVAG
jgi:hypothetical protein